MKIFRFSYILVSYIMLASIYLINHGVAIGTLLTEICRNDVTSIDFPNIVSFLTYIIIPVLATWLLELILREIKDADELKAEHITPLNV